MNTDQYVGTAKIAAGMLQQFAGLVLFNRTLNRRGFERRIAGEAQKAIGDAQRVLRAYHRRHTSSNDSSEAFPGGLSVVKD